ncbi:MAG: 7TM-DISM domain-containing protein, partial [Fulvivirga sp.]|uniref:7TMR-DISM family protein n=1 Tax=Fulvivirga sp. TaxID=1931237 RepID=UPI0032EB44F5
MRFAQLIIGFIVLFSGYTEAQESLQLNGQEEIDLNLHFHYFIDDSGKLSKEEVETKNFKPVPESGLRTNASDAVVWLKLDVTNRSRGHQNYYLQFIDPTIYELTMYHEEQSFQSGMGVRPSERFINSHKHTFFLKHEPQLNKQYFLRATSAIKITLDAKLIRYDVYNEQLSKERFFLGLFYGGMIILFVYSIILLITTRQRMFAYYAGYIFFVGLLTGAGDGIT